MKELKSYLLFFLVVGIMSCSSGNSEHIEKSDSDNSISSTEQRYVENHLHDFASFSLICDTAQFSNEQRLLIQNLLNASKVIDHLFWMQAYGDPNNMLDTISNANLKLYFKVNYGPWDRLNKNYPFFESIGNKPDGACFYPADITKAEYEKWNDPLKHSHYSVIRRKLNGDLFSVPYHVFYKDSLLKAAAYIRKAAAFAKSDNFRNYLKLRAQALLTDDYYDSDASWISLKANTFDFIIGPIESYEDRLFHNKTGYEAFLLRRNPGWTKHFKEVLDLIPEMQKELPCVPAYKRSIPKSNFSLEVFDVIAAAGQANAGVKTIALRLPNNKLVASEQGTRILQFRNVMKGKFEKVIVPIAKFLLDSASQTNVSFDALIENTVFHTLAHELGPEHTIDESNTIAGALKDCYPVIEEGKADILALWIAGYLQSKGQLSEHELDDNLVTYFVDMIREIRLESNVAQRSASLIRYNYFLRNKVFQYDSVHAVFKLDLKQMKASVNNLATLLLEIEGNGDYSGAQQFIHDNLITPVDLTRSLDSLAIRKIPKDIYYKQEIFSSDLAKK